MTNNKNIKKKEESHIFIKILKNKKIILFLVISIIFFIGCVQKEYNKNKINKKKEIDRLRSLPYLAYSEQPSYEKSGVIINNKKYSYPGYSLYVTRNLSIAELLDNEGNKINSWRDKSFNFWQDFELLPDGTFLVIGKKKIKGSNLKNRAILKFSWQGKKINEIPIPAHHEIHYTPGKPLITLLFDLRVVLKINLFKPIIDNKITSISESGEILESVSLYDLLEKSNEFEFQDVKWKKGKNRIDLFHSNTVEWVNLNSDSPIYSKNNIIVTIRHQDTIAIINWEKKKVLWTWGQGKLSGPHDATMLKNGNILVFDNGLGRSWSRVIEINPISKKIVWEYRDKNKKNFYTLTRGTSQRLPNGNTLITESNKGKVFEVTPRGEKVWVFNNPHKNKELKRANIIRMRRYSIEYIKKILSKE